METTVKNNATLESFKVHWVSLFVPAVLYFIGVALSVFIYFFGTSLFESIFIAKQISVLICIIIFFTSHHWLFIYMLHKEIEAYVVSESRITTFKFFPYVVHDTDHIEINDIREIKKSCHGIMQTILNYGDVYLITTSGPETLHLKYVPDPNKFVDLIESLRQAKINS